MPDPAYLATALAVAVAITVSLRAAPFAMRGAVRDSALMADIGRWMPLGTVAILAVYCLTRIEIAHGLPELAGLAVTVAAHWWRRNLLLSITAGTAVCLLLANTGFLA